MAFLSLNNLKKQFGTFSALKGIELEIQKGEFIVFVGPSGCGKSTLLRLIAGLETPESGSIYLDGREVTALPAAKRNLAMVFQTYALYPHMNVFQNLSFALRLAKQPKAEIQAKVHKAAELLKLSPYLYRFPKQLSGGQRQRVAIGRAIVREPKAFLFDEPLSNLDAALRAQTRVEIANLHSNLKATTIYVTHDQVEAMTLADRVIVLREGAIEQIGTPLELFDTPANEFVAQFIGTPKMNLLPLAALSPKSRAPFLTFLKQKQVSAKAVKTVGVRPEHLSVFSLTKKGKTKLSAAAKKKTFSAKVLIVEHLGAETLVYLTLEQRLRIVARSAERLFLTPNEPVAVQADFNKTHFFDTEEKALHF